MSKDSNDALTARLKGKREARRKSNIELYKYCDEHNIKRYCNNTMFTFTYKWFEYNLCIYKIDVHTNKSNASYIPPNAVRKRFRKFIYVKIDDIIKFYEDVMSKNVYN